MQVDESWAWHTDTGDEMTAAAGDWRVQDDAGSTRSVAADVFRKSYEQIGPGRYRRIGVFRARKVLHREVIGTLEGNVDAHPGDWVVEGAGGEQWPVPASKFAETYEELEGSGEER